MLEVGRINIAARATGVARAAFDAALAYAQQRETMGKVIGEHQAIQLKLADMATRLEASRLLTRNAAERKMAGLRCDVEAGMAKLFASETALELTIEAMRIHGGVGYTTELPVERFYRDAPLMVIGEGTNEIQRLVIARGLLARAHGLTERRQVARSSVGPALGTARLCPRPVARAGVVPRRIGDDVGEADRAVDRAHGHRRSTLDEPVVGRRAGGPRAPRPESAPAPTTPLAVETLGPLAEGPLGR